MNLELLLSLICIASNPDACSSIGQAYYKQSGYEEKFSDFTEKIERNNKKTAAVIVMASSINERYFVFPIATNTVLGYKYNKSDDSQNFFFKRAF